MVNLREHQQRALDNVKEIFEEDNKAIVVQPTGVGKTYIALKLFEENKDKKLTFVAPSQAILWEIKVKIAKEYGVKPEEYNEIFKNLELTTYQQINVDKKKDERYIKNFDSDYVVFDEAHHIGSDIWGNNAIELMEGHPETKFLGLTATPERTDEIDVVKDVFGGNLADEMSLEEAVADRLLKMPDYVNAIYSYKPIVEELEDRIESLKEINPEKYIMLKKDMEKAKNALEKADGMPEIFAKHIKEKDGRFIIFCKNIEHLKEMVNDSKTKGWFDGINKNVETLEIHSNEDEEQNRKILKRFKGDYEATEDALRVLFSVEKINEGIHIDNLDGVIMLRPTKSKIIYRQQLGRVMSISKKAKDGIVFDIVNNIDSFQEIHDFMDGVIKIRKEKNPEKDPKEIEKEVVEEFNITDETRAVREILRKVTGGLETEWEEFYQRSVRWREEHNGNPPIASRIDKNERNISSWERAQKLKYLKNYQDINDDNIPEKIREKIVKLKKLGLRYVEREYRKPEEHFNMWKKWTFEKEITPSEKSEDEAERKLAIGMGNILQRIKKKGESYKQLLEEYNEIYSKYGRRKNDKSPEKHFDMWKKWTLEKEITPSEKTEDEAERKVAIGMRSALVVMKRKEEYKEILQEYEEIYAKYGRRKDVKSPEEHFVEWKKWTEENGITPSQQANDEAERKVAIKMNNILVVMKKKEEYKEILQEYEEIYAKYGRRKNDKNPEEHFNMWKKWTLEKEITPSEKAEDEAERKVAIGMRSALVVMKKKEEYRKKLEEYEKLRAKYSRRKLKKLQKEKSKLLEDVTKLKQQAKDAEKLDNETKDAVQKVIDEKSQKREDIGE